MNQCKNCFSESLTYVTNYEHLDFDTNGTQVDDGWLCDTCECFHIATGEYFEFYSSYKEDKKVNYDQIMNK